MVFGVILAGGIGSRMGNVEKPKQYLNVGGKPIILHTLEKFYVNSKFEKLIVLCPSQWINHTKNLVKKNFNDDSKIVVIEGGSTRNETIMNSIRYIEKEYGLDDDTIIVAYISQNVISRNRLAAFSYHIVLLDSFGSQFQYFLAVYLL